MPVFLLIYAIVGVSLPYTFSHLISRNQCVHQSLLSFIPLEIDGIPVCENGYASEKQLSDVHQKWGIAALDSLLDFFFATWSLFRIECCCPVCR